LVALQKIAPAGPFALVARARNDATRLHTVLASFGYYRGDVAIRINGQPLATPSLPDLLQSLPETAVVPVDIVFTRGPLYHLRHIDIEGAMPADARTAFALQAGAPAVASDVLSARARLLAVLREDGYAMARVSPPDALVIDATQAMDIGLRVTTGPRVNLGPITLNGLGRVHAAFVRRRGQRFSPSAIEAARQDLASLGVFSSVRIRAAPRLSPDGTLKLSITTTERPRHAVTLSAAYSTDLGGSAGVTWSDRDVFGNAEQLNLTAAMTGLGGTATTALGYNVGAQFVQPDFGVRDQSLSSGVTALKQNLLSYDQTAVILSSLLTHKFSPVWSASGGLTATEESILQEKITRDYSLLALPLTARFDSTALADPLADPLHGVRASVTATPTASLAAKFGGFLIAQASLANYEDVSRWMGEAPGRSVLALRGLVGSAIGASALDLPPDQRFYGGGTASVRGYRYQSIGPLFADDTPQGGAAIDAATVEWRQRVWGPVGVAAFADAGQVSDGNAPFVGKLQVGYGVGVRYYTSIGPVRLDVALPSARPPNGDSFDIYIGLGQAF
jgi:translocation and assembly module TamA